MGTSKPNPGPFDAKTPKSLPAASEETSSVGAGQGPPTTGVSGNTGSGAGLGP